MPLAAALTQGFFCEVKCDETCVRRTNESKNLAFKSKSTYEQLEKSGENNVRQLERSEENRFARDDGESEELGATLNASGKKREGWEWKLHIVLSL